MTRRRATGWASRGSRSMAAVVVLVMTDASRARAQAVVEAGWDVGVLASGFVEPFNGIEYSCRHDGFFVAEYSGGRVSFVTRSGTVTRLAEVNHPDEIALDADETILAVKEHRNGYMRLLAPDSGAYLGRWQLFGTPTGIGFLSGGDLLVVNRGIVVRYPAAGFPTGAGASAWATGLSLYAEGLKLDALDQPSLAVTQAADGGLWRIVPSAGPHERLASGSGSVGLNIDPCSGDIFFTGIDDGTLRRLLPSGSVITIATGLSRPAALAFDDGGNVCVNESATGRVLRFTRPDGCARCASNPAACAPAGPREQSPREVRVSKDVAAADVVVSFDASAFRAEVDVANVHRGHVSAFDAATPYDHASAACQLSASPFRDAGLAAYGTGSYYYLVAGECRAGGVAREGSYGQSVNRARRAERPTVADLGNAACP